MSDIWGLNVDFISLVVYVDLEALVNLLSLKFQSVKYA